MTNGTHFLVPKQNQQFSYEKINFLFILFCSKFVLGIDDSKRLDTRQL